MPHRNRIGSFRRFARFARFAAAKLALLALAAMSVPALAVPSFSRQTGMACAACHVGGFGPQLTDFGAQFKLGAYTFSKGGRSTLPLAAMVVGSFTHTAAPLADPLPDHVGANDNLKLDQASMFIAGRLAEHLGTFTQITYDGIGRQLALDQADLRYARNASWGGNSVVAGVSLNNTPGSTDPYNTLPNWGYPYIASAVAPAPDAGTLLDGALAQRVLGLSAYAQVDGRWYGELGTYRTLSPTAQARLGLGRDGDPGLLHGAVYGRLAGRQAWGDHALTAGVVVFDTAIQPDRTSADRLQYRDLGLDLGYRWQPSDGRVVTLLANVVRERQSRDALVAAGAASRRTGTLTEHSVTGSYHWRTGAQGSWGLSLQRFGLRGDSDALLYADGFANGSPDFSGTRLQLDWTPFGQQPPGAGFDANWHLGAQWTAYDRFNGARVNYDGAGRNAADNNSLFVFAWLVF